MKHIYNWHKYVSTTKTTSNTIPFNTICPFSKNAKFTDDKFDVVIIEYDKYISPKQASKLENTLSKYKSNVVVLLEHFEDPGYIGDIYTGCGHNKILFLLQNRHKLNKAREILEKTDYYDNWSKEYKEKIWRNKW